MRRPVDECGLLMYEWNGTEYVGECDCKLQFRGRTEDQVRNGYYRHAGYLNPHLKREIERLRALDSRSVL
jgi:hypothetical protein